MDKMLWWVILVTFIAGVGGTGLGGSVSFLIKRDSTRTVSLLLSFAGGVMLAVVCFDLLIDALGAKGTGTAERLPIVLLGVAVGYALIAALNYIIDKSTNPEIEHINETHPKTADDLDELIHADHLEKHYGDRKNSLFVAGLIMSAAIALHNLPEGMVIGAAYTRETVFRVWTGSGFVMAVLIGLHNIPEGMAITVPLVAGGMKKTKAILITAASGFPTVIGAILGYWLGNMGENMQALALSFASGAMLYVVFGELLPESILMWRSKLPAVAVMFGIAVGMVIIYI
jgi:ZIP family zinc transporter